MSDHWDFWLGTVSERRTFHLRTPISEEEYSAIQRSLAAINRLQSPFNYKLVLRNFADLRGLHDFATINLSLGRRFAEVDRAGLGEALMGSSVNWLTAFRLFIDHEETGFKRRFGKSSPEFERFKAVQREQYDRIFGYRFVSRLRNYVLHCGQPLANIRLGSRAESSEDDTPSQPTVKFVLDRDILLEEFDGWGLLATEIRSLDPEFELLPLAADAMTGLGEVYRRRLEIEIDNAVSELEPARSALKKLGEVEPDRTPMVFAQQKLDERLNLKMTVLQEPSIVALAEIASGRRTPASIIVRPTAPRPPAMSPDTIVQEFHRDSRGVQALAWWLEQGGPTTMFFDAINRMIEEDGDVEPLLTGLIRTCTVLVHIAAAALGADARALVGGLLDLYPEAISGRLTGDRNRTAGDTAVGPQQADGGPNSATP